MSKGIFNFVPKLAGASIVACGLALAGMVALAIPASASTPDTVSPATVAGSEVSYAKAIEAGHKEKGWSGGRVPYSWGGGHSANAGPSLGTCVGYTGSIHPCPANHTKGVDCSGFVRWVYDLAYGRDVFGPGNTNNQVENKHMHRVGSPQPGDLVYYGTSIYNTHHVGIYIGGGKMIDALRTGTDIETDSVHVSGDLLGYYRYVA